ncbi:hypothetical protein SADUNF_Sadunf08G0171700 [Salix dunnii]|uniref:BHLH domain-containing protein n=1 Tax=Salix dunnii TaxID=1413687 RepID=A0A835MYF9_9ROSI|nr:hypothetical protein SADUNF_Sadunf08G0171700 [Salix dunnii]
MSHIAVERNRRRQMNEHLKVLRSLTPCFYIKRVFGGPSFYNRGCNRVRKGVAPSSPGFGVQKTKEDTRHPDHHNPFPFGNIENDLMKELGSACCNSPIADVEAKISGSNVILKVISRRIPGQIVRIISVLENLSFEILHLNISSMEDTVLYSFVIKIGIECQVSVEELAVEVQQSFFQDIIYTYEI